MGMKKILVIDYDQSSLASLQGILPKEGYQVVTAADGQSGWDKYNKESPDLVLMEAMLPKVHGFELCQRITSERNSQATVFIMTGVYKDRVYRTEALRTYGAAEYFEKPLKMAELLASIAAVLGKPETRSEARPEPGPAEACPAFAAAPAQPVRETRTRTRPGRAPPAREAQVRRRQVLPARRPRPLEPGAPEGQDPGPGPPRRAARSEVPGARRRAPQIGGRRIRRPEDAGRAQAGERERQRERQRPGKRRDRPIPQVGAGRPRPRKREGQGAQARARPRRETQARADAAPDRRVQAQAGPSLATGPPRTVRRSRRPRPRPPPAPRRLTGRGEPPRARHEEHADAGRSRFRYLALLHARKAEAAKPAAETTAGPRGARAIRVEARPEFGVVRDDPAFKRGRD